MAQVKPNRLRPGDTIAVLSPSWGGPSLFPGVFDLGLRNLEELFGLKIKEFPTARMPAREVYENPKLRADDLNRAFADPEVKGIFTSIGGDDSVRILPFLDVDLILANPKILIGFSDTAAIACYLNSRGLVTYNGPSILAGFAQARHEPAGFVEHVRRMLMSDSAGLVYEGYSEWADRYVEWATPGYAGEIGPTRPSEGWRWLQGSGVASGRLFGGCIEVLEFLKGTAFWPAPGFFKDKVLFFETSEEKPTVSNVKYMLRNYGSMGVFDEISGILFGRARAYSDAEKLELEKMIVAIVAGEFGRGDLPIVANMDFGHTDPQMIMPLGIEVSIDCSAKQVKLLESATH